MKKWNRILVISAVVTGCIVALLLAGGVAFAATSVDGFNDSLLALLDGLTEYFKAVLELFGMIL